jgi:tetratricopeptide (TPR) repeat protein
MSKAAESLFQKARDSAARRDLPRAIETASAAAKLDPARMDIWTFLGELQFNTGATAKATEALRQALRVSNGKASALHNLGIALKREGALMEAEAMLREAWRRDPNMIASVLSLSELLVSSARQDEAEALLTQCLTRMPQNFECLRELTNLFLQGAALPKPSHRPSNS